MKWENEYLSPLAKIVAHHAIWYCAEVADEHLKVGIRSA